MTGKRGVSDAEGRPVQARTVRVNAPSRAYDAIVGSGVLHTMADAVRAAAPGAKQAALFVDRGVDERAGSAVEATAASLRHAGLHVCRAAEMTIAPSEPDKSLATVGAMLGAMTAARLERGDLAVVLGGGVLGDLAGFAAASYRRGIRWINCPTTLLSMVDASVGGKTGANLSVGGSLKKNMVGAFWQPSLVVADIATLSTLAPRELRCGLAECIKHGMLAGDFGDAGLGDWTASNLSKFLALDPAALGELVARNITIKAAVIGGDEREEAPDGDGGRALLNLGHTFGHVLETLPDADLHHGEAVGLGLVAASAAAAHAKLVPPSFVEHTRQTVAAAGLPTRLDKLVADSELLDLMMHDKKVAGGVLRLILPCGPGRCRVVADPPIETVLAGWAALRNPRPAQT